MPPRQLGLLSFGVLVVIVAVLLLATSRLDIILSLTLTLYGLWVIVLAGIRAKNPVKYERGAIAHSSGEYCSQRLGALRFYTSKYLIRFTQ